MSDSIFRACGENVAPQNADFMAKLMIINLSNLQNKPRIGVTPKEEEQNKQAISELIIAAQQGVDYEISLVSQCILKKHLLTDEDGQIYGHAKTAVKALLDESVEDNAFAMKFNMLGLSLSELVKILPTNHVLPSHEISNNRDRDHPLDNWSRHDTSPPKR